MAIKTARELATAAKAVAKNYKTLYVMGCIGSPMTPANKQRYISHHSYNQKSTRKAMINAASSDTFGFDCVCFIKSLLWGWEGDVSKTYGGAKYASNNVPDIDANAMIKVCSDVSEDFSNVQVGEVVWLTDHIGVYIGDGLVVECSPKWANGVQTTALANLGAKTGYNARIWTKHGKLPYVTYEVEKPPVASNICSTNLPVLKKGSKGESVKALQILLIGNGYSCGSYGADGSFGNATDIAVRNFQKDKKLVVDGSVGPATWSKLLGI